MHRRAAISWLILSWAVALISLSSFAQDAAQSESTRKVVNRVVPAYPALARTMNLRGVVKIDAVVGSNGALKSVSVKGGHPVLVQAAQNALQKWRWEPAGHETHEPIEFVFDPK
jgi:TonB family protein